MPRFIEFLASEAGEVVAYCKERALARVSGYDRFASYLHEKEVSITIPQLKALTTKYLDLFKLPVKSPISLEKIKGEKDSPEAFFKGIKEFYITMILHPMEEVLDEQGNLHLAIVKAFDLDNATDKKNEFIRGMMHQVFESISVSSECKAFMQKNCENDLIQAKGAAISLLVNAYQEDKALADTIYQAYKKKKMTDLYDTLILPLGKSIDGIITQSNNNKENFFLTQSFQTIQSAFLNKEFNSEDLKRALANLVVMAEARAGYFFNSSLKGPVEKLKKFVSEQASQNQNQNEDKKSLSK